MKDKVVYFVIGLLVAITLTLLTIRPNNLTANNENEVFENVTIKGTLIVGEGANKITLKNDGKSEIIIQSRTTAISIRAEPNKSTVALIPDALDKNPKGIIINPSCHL